MIKKFFLSLNFILFPFLSRHSNILLAFLCVGGLFFATSIANAIEVGGHITEDTVWGPENNPYLVTEILYVDSGVTLTILPGTEIKVSGASCTSWQEFDQNFWLYGGVSIAKFIQVDGRIIAEGVEQDSIIFTRMQDDPDFYWGTIYITEQAEMCHFEHCKFEYSTGIGIALSNIAKAAVSIYNDKGLIRNCLFNNNGLGLITHGNPVKSLEISGSTFSFDNNINNFVEDIWPKGHIGIISPAEGFKPALLVNNEFVNDRCIHLDSVYYVDNQNTNCTKLDTGFDDETSYFYNNNFINCYTGIDGDHESFLYIKNNRFIGGYDGIDIDDAYVEISDNYFEGCGLEGPCEYELIGIIKNNIISNCICSAISGRFEDIYNNIFYDCGIVSSVIGSSNIFSNNLIINNLELCNLLADTAIFENNIFLNNNIENIDILNNPIFRNCILDFELPPECIDGGGNIWVDSLNVDSLFVDWQNGDFHLIEGSLAIDAGFDTLGYYYPFDMDYNHRVWDGDNNGNAIIDIGPYEYNSPAFGGIEGYTYKPTTGERVDYVLLKINNQPGEFTFSDSLGNFQYKLPAGVYDVYAERVFYEDVIEYQVEVFDGQFTQVMIPMTETVEVTQNQVPNTQYQLTNYPNPFNPSTTISFSVTQNAASGSDGSPFVTLEIFNIKGQRVKTLIDKKLQAGHHQVVWNGKDSNNKSVSSGIYFYRMLTKDFDKTKRMLLLK